MSRFKNWLLDRCADAFLKTDMFWRCMDIYETEQLFDAVLKAHTNHDVDTLEEALLKLRWNCRGLFRDVQRGALIRRAERAGFADARGFARDVSLNIETAKEIIERYFRSS